MRFIFKTDYDQDIRLFKHSGYVWSYALLAVFALAFPIIAPDDYILSIGSFILIYAIVGVGMMLLAGYTGQISLGHAAFLAIGAYTATYFADLGVPFIAYFPLAAIFAGLAGYLVGLPALRLSGIYLAIATLAFAFIVEQGLISWEAVTNGNNGAFLLELDVLGIDIVGEDRIYYLCLAVLVLVMFGAINLLRSPTGRAFIAIRDSEIAAESMGVNMAKFKTLAFALSAAIAGMAGVLYAYRLTFIAPEIFNIFISIEFIVMIVVGGLGSLHGAVFGAIFLIGVQQGLNILKDYLPSFIADQAGLEPLLFGVVLILFILFEPTGIYGRWVKIKLYFQLFPLYKKATFKRQKTYMKSERNR